MIRWFSLGIFMKCGKISRWCFGLRSRMSSSRAVCFVTGGNGHLDLSVTVAKSVGLVVPKSSVGVVGIILLFSFFSPVRRILFSFCTRSFSFSCE